MPENTGAGGERRLAALELLGLLAATAGFYALERLLARAGLDPLPEAFTGVGSITGAWLTVMLLVARHGPGWRVLGLGRPRPLWHAPLWALLVMVLLVAVQNTVVPLLARRLGTGGMDLTRYDVLYGNLPLALMSLASVWITAALFEEMIYRGFVVDRLHRLFGGGRRALLWAAALSGVPFGLIHFQWGLAGMIFTSLMGALLGGVYLLARRNLWPLILAHGILNSASVVQFYFVRASEVAAGLR